MGRKKRFRSEETLLINLTVYNFNRGLIHTSITSSSTSFQDRGQKSYFQHYGYVLRVSVKNE